MCALTYPRNPAYPVAMHDWVTRHDRALNVLGDVALGLAVIGVVVASAHADWSTALLYLAAAGLLVALVVGTRIVERRNRRA